ncbi:hypothetical protein RHMOL_Rhmol08G0250600 [Rhododendron molle]|uniref:Uncharacterized protein n=1 Tax=Rhododendron molle TaxID=49168 RepID=A0ACC0MU49_RHOML|nr:hypothetical protein RHMOL_Rhmol08G0250600 [Rhododendron molle]
MSPTNFSDQVMIGLPPVTADLSPSSGEFPEADVEIVTSGGLRIPAHPSILASASPVLESIIDRPRKHGSDRTIPVLGVPCEAVSVFIRFLYAPKCTEEEMGKYGIHLLALSHVFLVPQLKQRSTKAVGERLTIDNVIDVIQLARLCDAPDLHLKCMKLVSTNFKSVKKTEGWKFVQDHDPFLELQILQFIDETELRKKRTRRHREEQSLYLQLNEAMECLEHICTEGCTTVGPYDMEPIKNRGPCGKSATCQGLQLLIRHFATCKRRINGGCCRQFKMKAQQQMEKGTEDAIRWRLLVRKVVSAKAISSLSLPKRKREDEARERSDHSGVIRSFRL